MSALAKGAGLEELARAYFSRQGFFALRSVSILFEDDEVTDADVWLYGRQGLGFRTRTVVDVKDKKSPKAFERILWARGMQLATNCDRAVVVTTDTASKVARFATQQKVSLVTAAFLRHWAGTNDPLEDRLSLEEFTASIQSFSGHKHDGDWLKQIAAAKTATVCLSPFPAFNAALSSFRFFADRAATRPLHREQALRCAYLSAALACVALDAALEKMSFEFPKTRYDLIYSGVAYGDTGDHAVQKSIDTVLTVISKGVNNGAVLARQTRDALEKLFAGLGANTIAEFFAKEQNAAHLFQVARELEHRAHARSRADLTALSIEAKSIIGVFADFVGAKRQPLFNSEFVAASPASASLTPRILSAATKAEARPFTSGNLDELARGAASAPEDSSPSKEDGEPRLL